MNRQILHVDVNNAFLSWTALEMLKNGHNIDIRTEPCIIGGDEENRRGIVIAKSTKAKEYGIVTAETIYSAKSKCPWIKIYKGLRHSQYKEYSNKLYNLLSEYTDIIERFSIDECFLDMTQHLKERTLLEIGKEINARAKKELGFTVNVGVAHNKLLAKMASDFEKPDKVHTLFEDEIESKMWKLPVSELFMLGKKTVPKLNSMGINTIGDLARYDRYEIIKKFGKYGNLIWEYANGIDNSEVKYIRELPKSIGHSITLPEDITKIDKLEPILLTLTEHVAFKLRKYNLLANTVNLQLRTNQFKNFSHQKKLLHSTASTKEIYKTAKEILGEMYKEELPIRLIGIKVDNLVNKEEGQMSFFTNRNVNSNEKLDKAVDDIKCKFGFNSITLAGTLETSQDIKIISTE